MAFCTTCGSNVTGAFCTQCGTPLPASGGQPAAPPPPPPPPPPPASPQFTPQYQPPQQQYAPPPQQQYAPPQQQQYAPPPPPPPQQPMYGSAPMGQPMGAPVKKGMSPVVIILMVVGGLVVLGVICVIAAGLFFAHKVKQYADNPGLAIAKLVTMGNPDAEVLNTNDSAGTITIRDRKTGKVSTMKFDDVRNGGKFSITTDDDKGGTASVQFGGDVGKLPSWVPQYPGSTPKATMSVSGSSSEGNGGNYTFTTSDSAARVTDFFKEKIKDAGLKVTTETNSPVGSMITSTSDDERRTLLVVIGGSGGETTVNVTFTEKK